MTWLICNSVGSSISYKGKLNLGEKLVVRKWGDSTVNLTMENHRQWRITRKGIAEFLES